MSRSETALTHHIRRSNCRRAMHADQGRAARPRAAADGILAGKIRGCTGRGAGSCSCGPSIFLPAVAMGCSACVLGVVLAAGAANPI